MTDADRIRNFLAKRGRQSGKKTVLTGETKLFEKQILDSFGVLELFAFLEEEFGVAFDRADLDPENFGTINAIAAFVESRRKTGKRAS